MQAELILGYGFFAVINFNSCKTLKVINIIRYPEFSYSDFLFDEIRYVKQPWSYCMTEDNH